MSENVRDQKLNVVRKRNMAPNCFVVALSGDFINFELHKLSIRTKNK